MRLTFHLASVVAPRQLKDPGDKGPALPPGPNARSWEANRTRGLPTGEIAFRKGAIGAALC
jgi:hypothetical protein